MFLLSVAVLVVTLMLAGQVPISDEVSRQLEEFFVRRDLPDEALVALSFVLGMAAFHTPLKIVLRYFATVVHELGHAFMAGALLARPRSIQIHPSSSGLAIYELSPNWGRFRASLVSAAGYPAPGLASLAAIYAVQEGYGVAWTVFATAVLGVSVVLLIRNLWGFLWTSAIIAGSYFGLTQLSPVWISCAAVFVTGFLALSAIEFAWVQVRLVRLSPGSGVDAESISHYLGLPAIFVAWVHLLISLGTSGLTGFYALSPYIKDMIESFV